jgi:HAD superfamily hydrolase (TIGR01450 family)
MSDSTPSPRLLLTARRVLSDLDGCLAAGNVPLPGAAELAARLGQRLLVVSNNSTETGAGLARVLAEGGLEIPAERIVLAGETLLRTLAGVRPGARVLLAAAGEMPALAEDLGLRRDETRPEIVVLCRDTSFDYARLQSIAAALAGGAELWVANPDLTHPGAGGRIVPETGALLAAVQATVQATVQAPTRAAAPQARPRVFGKPQAALYRAALGAVEPRLAVMLGDNPDTDIAGARALGLPGLLLGRQPEAAAPDLKSLLQRALAAEEGAVS